MNGETIVYNQPHCSRRMRERGVTRREVAETIGTGERRSLPEGRTMIDKVFAFHDSWRGRHYRQKKVRVFVTLGERIRVHTVLAFYIE